MTEDIEKALETGDLGNVDPMVDAPNSNAPAPTVDTTVEDIGARLSKKEETVAETGADEATPSNPAPMDLSMFTPEMLQQLKMMLNATPDRLNRKKEGIEIKLRTFNDQVVVKFSKAFNGYIVDPDEPSRRIMKQKMKIWTLGNEEPTEVLFEEFHMLPRRVFKVTNTRVETNEVEEGETIHAETGKLVTMVALYSTRHYTVDIDGTKVEISDAYVNG